MLKENTILEKLLAFGRSVVPKRLFRALQPAYHWCLAWFGALVYGFPGRELTVIGITGTKGKSTVVYLISKIFEEARLPVAAIGSLGFKIKDKEWPNDLKMTMPGRLKLQKFLKTAKDAGCKYVALEVTSEGINQKRHLGIPFDCAVFTNLAPEHIESHGSFENYRAAKLKLFKKVRKGGTAIVNGDDEHAHYFLDFPLKNKIRFGIKSIENDIYPEAYHVSENGIEFAMDGTEIKSPLLGEFNLYNILAAIAVAKTYGITFNVVKRAIEKVRSLAGRMEEIRNECGFRVFVDYAHTPDSLEATYKIFKPMAQKSGSRLLCVFGAPGGGRDQWKRPKMGEVAGKYCDEIILTMDDPYDEDPLKIISQIQAGMKKIPFVIEDRKDAIAKAIGMARAGDVIVISGKGSETRLVLARGKKIPWSDAEAVKEILQS